MTDVDPHATRRDLVPNIPAELLEAGFDNVEEIGRGGFGVVYRCVQPSLDRAVAVKVLSTDLDRDNLERFLREQRAMGRLSGHPHIVTVLQVGVLAGGRPFIVMPYHAKNSLETLI
ncbi:protein kinase domain-containing protein, partial [Mycobacterium tuberculosis]